MLRGDWFKKKLGRSTDSLTPPSSSVDTLHEPKRVTGDIADYDKNRAALLSPPLKAKGVSSNPFASTEESDDEEAPSTNPFSGSSRTYNDLAAQEEEDAIQSLKQQRKSTQQASLESSRRSKQRLLQTEEVAYDTMSNLNQQSEQLGKAAYGVDNINYKAKEAEFHYHELKRLHKFLPFSFKSEKRRKEAYKNIEAHRKAEQARHDELLAYKARKEMMEEMHLARKAEDMNGTGHYTSSRAPVDNKKATLSEDELVQAEMDDNLDDISDILRRLGAAAQDMNRSLDEQAESIDRISAGTEKAGSKVHMLNQKITKYT